MRHSNVPGVESNTLVSVITTTMRDRKGKNFAMFLKQCTVDAADYLVYIERKSVTSSSVMIMQKRMK